MLPNLRQQCPGRPELVSSRCMRSALLAEAMGFPLGLLHSHAHLQAPSLWSASASRLPAHRSQRTALPLPQRRFREPSSPLTSFQHADLRQDADRQGRSIALRAGRVRRGALPPCTGRPGLPSAQEIHRTPYPASTRPASPLRRCRLRRRGSPPPASGLPATRALQARPSPWRWSPATPLRM